jgi:hypothetical protein
MVLNHENAAVLIKKLRVFVDTNAVVPRERCRVTENISISCMIFTNSE